MKNEDFSYENFNLNENFQKSELNAAVFGRISKTINLIRVFENFKAKKYFAKWLYVTRTIEEQQKLLKNINYDIVKLLTFWNVKEEAAKVQEEPPKRVVLAIERKRSILVKVVEKQPEAQEEAENNNVEKTSEKIVDAKGKIKFNLFFF